MTIYCFFPDALRNRFFLDHNLQRLFRSLFNVLLSWFLTLACVFEALLVVTILILANFQDEFDVVLHNHVQEIAHGGCFGRRRGYQLPLLKAGVNPARVDVVFMLYLSVSSQGADTHRNPQLLKWPRIFVNLHPIIFER